MPRSINWLLVIFLLFIIFVVVCVVVVFVVSKKTLLRTRLRYPTVFHGFSWYWDLEGTSFGDPPKLTTLWIFAASWGSWLRNLEKSIEVHDSWVRVSHSFISLMNESTAKQVIRPFRTPCGQTGDWQSGCRSTWLSWLYKRTAELASQI